jgi:hypothetical protein
MFIRLLHHRSPKTNAMGLSAIQCPDRGGRKAETKATKIASYPTLTRLTKQRNLDAPPFVDGDIPSKNVETTGGKHYTLRSGWLSAT